MKTNEGMKTIKKKIRDLLVVSAIDVFGKDKVFDALQIKMKQQDALIDELKELAKENNTLLGRVIRFPHADSYAVYLITGVYKHKVYTAWIDYCDGWQDDILEDGGNLDINIAIKKIAFDDQWETKR